MQTMPMTPLREPQTLRATPETQMPRRRVARFCRRPGKGMAPRGTRLLPAAAAHLPSSQGSCTAFLREGNIVVGHSRTWGSGSQPRRPACPAYAASPPPPRPPVRPVRPVRPSVPAGCASEPQLIRFCCGETRAGPNFSVPTRTRLDVTGKGASSLHPGQRPANKQETSWNLACTPRLG